MKRSWRNWQTRKTKDLVIAFRSWKFESSRPHLLEEVVNAASFFAREINEVKELAGDDK